MDQHYLIFFQDLSIYSSAELQISVPGFSY